MMVCEQRAFADARVTTMSEIILQEYGKIWYCESILNICEMCANDVWGYKK
jgi:hypothetical protein